MTKVQKLLAVVAVCAVWSGGSNQAMAWDAYGHKLITRVAVEGMTDAPQWIKDKNSTTQISDAATMPDRWRSTKINQLVHLNNPEHYLDVEDLEPYGLTLQTLPTLRYEFVKELALAKQRAGSAFKGRPVNPARDVAKTDELPGFLPYAIVEQYAKVQNAFLVVRTIEKINDPRRQQQLAMARDTARVQMSILAHYVGDAAQPLHMTKHHHGWVGSNPKGYTTDRGIHSYIDGKIVSLHQIKTADLKQHFDLNLKVEGRNPWGDVIQYLNANFEKVEPLYELQKSGELEQPKGKEFIGKQMAYGASMLSALYRAAWESSAPTDKDIEDFKKYDGPLEGSSVREGEPASGENVKAGG